MNLKQEIAQQIGLDPIGAYRRYVSPTWARTISKLPAHMHAGIALYVILGIQPGRFLSAVIENDFVNAACGADTMNKMLLAEYGIALINAFPTGCWGRKGAIEDWSSRGGLLGINPDEMSIKYMLGKVE